MNAYTRSLGPPVRTREPRVRLDPLRTDGLVSARPNGRPTPDLAVSRALSENIRIYDEVTMKRSLLLVASLLLAVAGTASAKSIRIPRHPDYHDGKIAFSYMGDVWVVNDNGANPRRLTVHTARDVYPRFSPDGQWIAFSSNRYGNYDVFVIPAEGGRARQLTFQSGADTVVGWARD